MTKHLPEEAITNELKGRSAFFLPNPPQAPIDVYPRDTVRTPARVNVRTPEQPHGRTDELPRATSNQRTIKRQSYNVYLDQHEALKRLEATSILSGKGKFISEMVREALEAYLKEKA